MTEQGPGVIVLTAGAPLEDALAERVREAAAGAAMRRLAPEAAEFEAPKSALAAARAAASGAPVDVNWTPAEGRRKRVLIADMDSTIITVECVDELADFAGVKDRVAAITERAMRGELDFEQALTERVGLLKGLPEASLQTCFDERVHLTAGAEALVRTMRAQGALTALVSGGFTFFTELVAARAGFERNRANELLLADGALTGDVARPILGRAAKLEALEAFVAELEISSEDVIAVGDGANDLAMIGAAGLGVAFRAKPAVAQAADCAIEHADLTALLYLQGFSAAEMTVG